MKIRKYNSIDLVKFCMAIAIVALHASALQDVNPTLNLLVCEGIARLGVPFFFVVSAYFLYSKPVSWETTKRYCKRLLILYAAWFIISIPKTIFDRFICSGYPFGETLFRFVRSFFISSTFSGSWFIVSCIFCALLFYCIEKKLKKTKIIIISLSIVVYIWVVFSSAYGKLMVPMGMSGFYKTYTLLFSSPYSSFLVGIPYFALGRYYAHIPEWNHLKRNWIMSVLCVALLLVEVYFTNKYGLQNSTDCYLMLLPCIVFIFPLILNWNIQIKNSKNLRIASTVIFFSQFIFLFLCEITEWTFKITIPCFGKFVFTIICGLVLSQLLIALSNKKGFYWLRYFY